MRRKRTRPAQRHRDALEGPSSRRLFGALEKSTCSLQGDAFSAAGLGDEPRRPWRGRKTLEAPHARQGTRLGASGCSRAPSRAVAWPAPSFEPASWPQAWLEAQGATRLCLVFRGHLSMQSLATRAAGAVCGMGDISSSPLAHADPTAADSRASRAFKSKMHGRRGVFAAQSSRACAKALSRMSRKR